MNDTSDHPHPATPAAAEPETPPEAGAPQSRAESQDLADGPAPSDAESGEITAETPGGRPPVIRTGAEQPWEPEDLAIAEGRDPTPKNVERARRELDELGPAAIEKTVP